MRVIQRTQAPALLVFLAGGVVVGTLAVLISAWLAGGGHGSYVAAKLLLPFSMITTIPSGELNIVSAMLALAQWPTYGGILSSASARNRQKAILTLAVVHTIAVLGSLTLVSRETFP